MNSTGEQEEQGFLGRFNQRATDQLKKERSNIDKREGIFTTGSISEQIAPKLAFDAVGDALMKKDEDLRKNQ